MKPLQSMQERTLSPADKLPRGGMLRSLCNRLHRFPQAALMVVFATLSSLSWGEPIGRLFFTPDERAHLDRTRLSGGSMGPEGAPAQQSESLTLNGIVKRSSGKITVWINNSAQNESELPPGSKSQASKTRLPDFPVLVQKTGKTVRLKVGQTLNIDSGEIRESYQMPPQVSTSPAKTPDSAVIGAPPRNHS